MTNAQYERISPDLWEGEDVKLCLAYWNELRGERFAPQWSSFDWSRIPVGIIPYFSIVDICWQPYGMTYRFFGSAHSRAHGIELTGRSPLEMDPPDVGQSMFDQYTEIANERVPGFFLHTLYGREGDLKISETSLRMPFSNDGEIVSNIVAFTDLRVDFELAQKYFLHDRFNKHY
jgi:hypothetical protein